MSSFSRLFDMASKALGTPASSSGSPAQGGARDWRSMVRDVADAVTGDSRSGASGHPASPSSPGYAGSAPSPARDVPPMSTVPGGIGLTPPPAGGAARATGVTPPVADAADRAAIARYEYLLQTADPHQVETIHREAFARLTPQQRAQVQQGMRAELRPTEQPRSAEPADLARAAARTEAMRPGIMAGLLARAGGAGHRSGGGQSRIGAVARGTALAGAGGLLGAVAGGAIVSAVAAPLLAQAMGMGIDFDAVASGLDIDALADGVDVGAAGDLISGAGDAVSGFGDHLSNVELPGLGDLFG